MVELKYTQILQENKILKEKVSGEPFRVAILSNITVNTIKELIEYDLRRNGVNPIVEFGNFDNIVQDSLEYADHNLVIIFFDLQTLVDNIPGYFEGLSDDKVDQVEKRIMGEIDLIFSNLKTTATVVFNKFTSGFFPSGFIKITKIESLVDRLNRYLTTSCPMNVELLDLGKVVGDIGIGQAIDVRFYYSSKAPYTIPLFKKYMEAIKPIILRVSGKFKKALVFDCDNTLWKGVIGEDGMDKIEMSSTSVAGRPYFEVQRIAKFLSERGVMICICSKNNADDVEDVFLNHKDMVLRNEDIILKKVNWIDKATNIREISRELNIGLESIIFIDDSAMETDLIRQQVPEITVFQVPAAVHEYPKSFLNSLYNLFDLSGTEEDRKRTTLYKEQFVRQSETSKFESIEDYLSSLDIFLSITLNDKVNIGRIAQLTQKTNQFNLTTIRYSEAQIAEYMEDHGTMIFSVFIKDKFGDSGITAICIVKEDPTNNKAVFIDSFLMSCRIIGRNIEVCFLDFVLRYLKDRGYENVLATYRRTQKNGQVESFYEKMGFKFQAVGDDGKDYFIILSEYVPFEIAYIRSEFNGSLKIKST
ncbi:MAG: HAD-IIIC family phosphatase [Chitinophagaceae bacterium]|nr:HAD-IIIC family phosphatase [Chitinophagaceae bacterium]